MTREVIGPIFLMVLLSNWLLNIFICIYRFALLSPLIREASYYNREWLMQRHITVQSAQNKWLCHQYHLPQEGSERIWETEDGGGVVVKCCFLHLVWLLHTWIKQQLWLPTQDQHKIKSVRNSDMERDSCIPTPSWGAIGNEWFWSESRF